MKCSKYLMLVTLLASLSFSSCDLERLPLTDLSEENFWNDAKKCRTCLDRSLSWKNNQWFGI